MLFLGAWQRHLLEKMGYNRGILYSLCKFPPLFFLTVYFYAPLLALFACLLSSLCVSFILFLCLLNLHSFAACRRCQEREAEDRV